MLHALILPPQWYTVPVHIQPAAKVLKALIIILLIGVLVSLFTGLTFLFQDTGRPNSKRTWYALGVRVTLATALVLTMSYGCGFRPSAPPLQTYSPLGHKLRKLSQIGPYDW